jgi:3-deoxy-D-manno-octulosonic-acid transferase
MFFYNLSIYLFGFIIQIASVFNSKAKLWIDGRKNIFEKLKTTINSNAPIVWFHVASLGEFEQGQPVIESFRLHHPHYKILLTFFSPSGYEVKNTYKGADYVFYLPLDTKKNAGLFIEIVKPKMVFLVKYEFWINYINTLYAKKIPVYSISSIFNKNQIYFKSYGRFYAEVLKKISFFFVQNDASEQLLQSIGVRNILISGDTRFDRVTQIAASATTIPIIEKFKGKQSLFIAGSSWEKDEDIIIKLINNYSNDYKFIIAPHQIQESKINKLIYKLKENVIRFSQAEHHDVVTAKIMIIDNIGMLSSLYQYANIAYVGGGFGTGIHNILEPSVFMIPVIFGPHYHKFQEAHDLIKLKAAFTIKNESGLIKIFEELSKPKNFIESHLALLPPPQFEYFKNKRGATNKILEKIFK